MFLHELISSHTSSKNPLPPPPYAPATHIKTVLVDNSPYAYGYHLDNGIPIESWFDDDNDTELLKLMGFLRRLHTVEDVRHVLRDHFKTYQLVESAGMSNDA